mmetsp:Transcript_58968/g.117941  ORF Transcript_58968/g.117941 Transcript_58968/m.117941 type:complete len:404 (+) Transcript_58968:157-1368(+)
MPRSTAVAGIAALAAGGASVSAFVGVGPSASAVARPRVAPAAAARETSSGAWGGAALGGVMAAASVGVAASALSRKPRSAAGSSVVACRAQADEPSVADAAKQAVGSATAAVLLAGSMADSAVAYPIFAQQNYANPQEATGKLACANCHLASKPLDVRMPVQVLPDTIFKTTIEIPAKYEKRMQPIASGEKGPMNVGAIAIMPEGWKLAPKDRLPKVLKKEMKGLAWAQYSKEKPNIVVAGPVPGSRYEKMTLPILAPDPNTQKDLYFDKYTFYYGGNRGRGQVYPEGNLSNNNQFFAPATGKVSEIDGLKVTVTKEDGTTAVQECLPGADIVVEVGEAVTQGDPITTNPNVGGFGQEEKEMTLQDINRIYAYCALATSIFLAQLSFVLKKKQFEKVQLAEGF